MIRLSEAIAKANCVTEVTPDFVREAYNLLRQSIISVEKDDVEVEEEEDETDTAIDGEQRHNGNTGTADDDAEMADADGATSVPRRERTKITYDRYMSILNLMVRRVTEDQTSEEDGVEEEELLVWYLEQRESELETQDDLEQEKILARKVLTRMVKVMLYFLFVEVMANFWRARIMF